MTQVYGRTRASDTLDRVARMMRILKLLHDRKPHERISLQMLADACECVTRTIERDIALLQHDYDIDYDRRTKTFRLLTPASPIDNIDWTPDDTLSLALATALFNGPDIPHGAAIQTALRKITGTLSPELRRVLNDAASVVHAGPGPRDYSQAPVAELADAATQFATIDIDYESYSSGTRRWRRIDPYQINRRDGGFLELHAWCHTNESIRAFAVDRIRGVRPTGQTFRIDQPAWSVYISAKGIVGGLRGGEPVDVHVRFSPEVARYACDHNWPDGLSVELSPDRAAILTGTVQGTASLIGELLRWKRHVTVIGGNELRKAMREEIEAMADVYRADDKLTPEHKV